jgi:hypothetical protein
VPLSRVLEELLQFRPLHLLPPSSS